MTYKIEILCDWCEANLRYTKLATNYRLHLTSELIRTKDQEFDTVAKDPLDDDKHFCDICCLNDWLTQEFNK